MGQQSQITFEPKLANITIENFSFFVLFQIVKFTHILLGINFLLTTDQSTHVSTGVYKLFVFLFILRLRVLLEFELLPSEVINLSDNFELLVLLFLGLLC